MTKSAENKHKTRIDEGGYYAIKGFLYQFDKTLIEVITNPQTSVAFENRQDIDYEDYALAGCTSVCACGTACGTYISL